MNGPIPPATTMPEPASEEPSNSITQPVNPGGSSLKTWWKSLFSSRSRSTELRDAFEEILEQNAADDDETITLDEEERLLIRNVLAFGEITVDDVMTPQPDMIAAASDSDFDSLRGTFIDSRHTRIPIYSGDMDHISGFVHAKDLLPLLGEDLGNFSVESLLRDILFVPPSMRVMDLLLKMRVSGTHMAIVVDEYGGTMGLVTLEDVCEEIVGEIQDEHDDAETLPEPLIWGEGGTITLDAKERIERVEQELHIEIRSDDESDDYDTMGGLVFSLLGRVPTPGEVLTHQESLRIEVLDSDERRIHQLRVTRLAA